MAIDVERLIVRMEANQKTFERQLKKANQLAATTALNIERRFDKMNKNVSTGFSRIGLLGSTFLSGLGTRAVIQYADAWTEAGNKIAAASQVAGLQARSLERLNDLADENRAGISETVDLYSRLLRSSKGIAKSEEDVAKATQIAIRAFKAGGASATEFRSGVLQLGQALGSGFLQGDELRSLRENAPLIAQAIADEFGVTIGELKKLGAEGALTSKRVFRALLSGQAEIDAAFAKTNATIGDSFARLRNALTEYVGLGAQSTGATEKLAKALTFLADNLDLAVAAGVVLGSRFIGPILGTQLGRAIVSIRAASAALAGLSAGARVAAGGLGIVRGVLAAFGGPVGLAIGALALLPLATSSSADGINDMSSAGEGAVAALNAYAAASKSAAAEQDTLGGKVSATTQQILQQSRAELQTALREFVKARDEVLNDLTGVGLFDNSEIKPLADRFEFASNLPLLKDIADQLRDIGAGAGDIQATSAAMERLAGIGKEVREAIQAIELAELTPDSVDLEGAIKSLIELSKQIGGFEEQLNALDASRSFAEQTGAVLGLKLAMQAAARAGEAMRGEQAETVRALLSAAGASEEKIRLVTAALSANNDELQDLANGLEDADAGAANVAASAGSISFATAAASAANLANELGRAVGNAARLANQGISSLRQSEIELQFKGDPVGRAGALARERFNSDVDISSAPDALRIQLEKQREAYVSNAIATERNAGALADWTQAQRDAAKAGGISRNEAQKDFNKLLTIANEIIEGNLSAEEKLARAIERNSSALPALVRQIKAEAKARGQVITNAQAEKLAKEELAQANMRLIEDANGLTAAGEEARASLKSAFVGVITGANSFGDALKGVLKRLAEIAASNAFDKLAQGLGGSSGGGGIFRQIFGGLFGGFREHGGRVSKGSAYVVGEKRPELFVPDVPGRIVSSVPSVSGASSHGSGASKVDVFLHPSGEFDARVESVSGNVAVKVSQHAISENNRVFSQVQRR